MMTAVLPVSCHSLCLVLAQLVVLPGLVNIACRIFNVAQDSQTQRLHAGITAHKIGQDCQIPRLHAVLVLLGLDKHCMQDFQCRTRFINSDAACRNSCATHLVTWLASCLRIDHNFAGTSPASLHPTNLQTPHVKTKSKQQQSSKQISEEVLFQHKTIRSASAQNNTNTFDLQSQSHALAVTDESLHHMVHAGHACVHRNE